MKIMCAGKTETDKFWEKVVVGEKDECWIWSASCTSYGYGQFSSVGGRVYAHRYSYELHNGKMPDGLLVCHHCDNPPCVNPEHLFLGTHTDNAADMMAKDRQNKVVGSKNGRAKLSEDDVLEIRRLYPSGFLQEEIADMFGVTGSRISRIVNRKEWKHL